MRNLIIHILAALVAVAAWAQPQVQPEPVPEAAPTMAMAASPETLEGGLQEAKFRIPDHVVDGWYARGDAEAEAENLEYFLRALIWGPNPRDHEQAMAEGKMIDVDFSLLQAEVRETAENVDRIGDTIDPGLEPFLRQRALQQAQGQQVATGISQLPADVGAGIIGTGPTRSEIAAANAARQSSASRGSSGVSRHILQYDDSATKGQLRVTLIDLYEDRENNDQVTAVLLLQSPAQEDEVELVERRRTVFDRWTIRFVEATMSDEEIVLEIWEN